MKKNLMFITAAGMLLLLVMTGVFAGGQQDSAKADEYLRVEYTLDDVKDVKLMNGEEYGVIGIDPIKPGRPLKVGFSQMEVNNTWRIVNNESFQHAAKVRGYDLVYRDAQSSIEKQNRDVIDILNEGV